MADNYKLDYTGEQVNSLLGDINKKADKEAGIVAGMILMWSGSTTSVPEGWNLCDGTNGTPDLRNRFIVGAGSSYSVGSKGGSDTVTLTTAQIPSHSHTYFKGSGNKTTVNEGSGWGSSNVMSSLSTSDATTGSAGSGSAHENRPPYYALAYIMKL